MRTSALWNTPPTQLLWLTGLVLSFVMQPITAIQGLAIVAICSLVFAAMFGAWLAASRR